VIEAQRKEVTQRLKISIEARRSATACLLAVARWRRLREHTASPGHRSSSLPFCLRRPPGRGGPQQQSSRRRGSSRDDDLPSTQPTMARIPTGFLKILSLPCFSQESKYKLGKSNERIATGTAHSITTTTTPRACPLRSPELAPNPNLHLRAQPPASRPTCPPKNPHQGAGEPHRRETAPGHASSGILTRQVRRHPPSLASPRAPA
jgi:hypothetical protein